jgi:hypothetical protein
MATNKGLGLPQQRGTFEIKGIVMGTLKEKFSTSTKTKTGKDFRSVNFGVTFDKDQTLFVGLTGMPQENVYFSKKGEGGAKPDVKTVPWKDRHTFRNEGYTLIGVNCGLVKTSKDGKEVNDIKRLAPFDACKYIEENLKDGESVFIRGNIEYSHYANQAGELQRNSKLVITQIFLCNKPVDFEAVGFEPDAKFTQPFVFTSVRKEESNFAVEARVVNYATIEDTEFVVQNPKLAENLRKSVKPYTAMKTWGDIRTVKNTEVVEESSDDGWGEKNTMDRVTGQYRKTLIITGVDPESFDREAYTETLLDKAIETMKANENAKKDFGDGEEDWGGDSKISGEKKDDDDEAWS